MHKDELPSGVKIVPLQMHHDDRGMVAELYRKEWAVGLEALQWNVSHSKTRVLRGVHLHWKHMDYLIVLKGHMTLYLHDVRPGSISRGQTFVVDLKDNALQAAVIPTGVAHGFYFNQDTTHIYAVSEYWNHEDELGCMWNSPELNISWPTDNPMLSLRDQNAFTYNAMIQIYINKSEKAKLCENV